MLRYFSALILILSILLEIYGFRNGWFSSVESMKSIILQNEGLAPLIFILFQIFQVVVPIIPGGVGCIVGVLLFGPVWGFVYNYIGGCLGSFIAFSIAKTCGPNILYKLFPQKLIDKYKHWTSQNHRFDKLFAWAVFLPFAPDDYLCYLAGTTQITWKSFVIIILSGKVLCIGAYSLGSVLL